MEVFYLKVNRAVYTTARYLQQWIDNIKAFADSRIYVICDNPSLTEYLRNTAVFGDIPNEFMQSMRDSETLKYIVDNMSDNYWKPASYAQLTTFLHARDNGYKDFWNIDADDLGLYAEPDRIAQILKTAKNYANNHDINMFSLDMCFSVCFGHGWSFGCTYVNNSINWMQIMTEHCTDDESEIFYGNLAATTNTDWFCDYLRRINAAVIESFYVENLQMIHHHPDTYITPGNSGLRYWQNGRLYFPVLCNDFGMDDTGYIFVHEDVVKIDVGLTLEESKSFLKEVARKHSSMLVQRCYDEHGIDLPVTIILPITNDSLNENFRQLDILLNSLADQELKNFQLVVTVADGYEYINNIKQIGGVIGKRLKLVKSNSNDVFEMLNVGLKSAQGKYIAFVDVNTVLAPNFLTTLHSVAEQSNADVVHMSNYFISQGEVNENGLMPVTVATEEIGRAEDKKDAVVELNLDNRLLAWNNGIFPATIFNKLIRREFLSSNNITFETDAFMPEWIFSFQCILSAKNYVRIPQSIYVRMTDKTSIKRQDFNAVYQLAVGNKKILDCVKDFDIGTQNAILQAYLSKLNI